jgi:hypothetical protein
MPQVYGFQVAHINNEVIPNKDNLVNLNTACNFSEVAGVK